MSLLLAVTWPVVVVALGAAALLAACAWIGGIALLARSDGDAEQKAAAASWREATQGAWRGRTRVALLALLAAGVVGSLIASGGAARVAWCAALVGACLALLAEWLALLIAGALVPRVAAAAAGGDDEAAAMAARGARVASNAFEALLLAAAAIGCLVELDARAWLAAASAAWAMGQLRSIGAMEGWSSAVASGGATAVRMLAWLVLPALQGGAPFVAVALLWRSGVALLDRFAARMGASRPALAEAAAALLLPPFFARLLAGAADGGVAASWSGGSAQLPLLLGIAAWPLLEPLAAWQAERGAAAGGEARSGGDAAGWMIWCGALLAAANWLGGAVGAAWLALGFLTALDRSDLGFSVACREEASRLPGRLVAPPARSAIHATLGGFGELLAAGALALQLSPARTDGLSHAAGGGPLAAVLAGGLAVALLRSLLERAVAMVPAASAETAAASTGAPARAMIPAVVWTAIVAYWLPQVFAADLGSALAGMLLVGCLALPFPARTEADGRRLLPRWLLLVVLLVALLAAQAAAVPDGR